MSKLTESYQFYLRKLDECSLLEFLDVAFNYDFIDYEVDIADMGNMYFDFSSDLSTISLKSNGSTGNNSTYDLGPNGATLISGFENRQRNSASERVMVNFRNDFYQTERFADFGNSIFSDLASEKGAEYLVHRLSCRQEVTIEAFPNVIMAMTCHEMLLDFFLNNKHINIFSSCWDAFYNRKKLKALDRMVDWKTGVNFHECDAVRKHVVPIWLERDGFVYNLLNLKKTPHEISDIINLRGFQKCSCGRVCCDFSFVPHYKNRPKINGEYVADLSLAERMDTKLLNIQFVQMENDEFQVYYDMFDASPRNRILDSDKEIIHDFLGGHAVSYKPFRSYIVGSYKYPTFWRGFNKANIVDNICTII